MNRRAPLAERFLLRMVGHDSRGRGIAGDLREEYARWPHGPTTRTRYALACVGVALRYAPGRMARGARQAAAGFIADLRRSARALPQTPIYWIGCTLTLALGLGAATTIGIVVYGALLKPLPFPHSERLVRFGDASLEHPAGLSSASFLNFLDLQQRAQSFEVMAAYSSERAIVSGPELSERMQGAFVSPNFFDVFELPPLAGRWFEPGDQAAAVRSVIISERTWRRLFGARRDAIGQRVQIDLVDHTVVGIAGANQVALGAVDFWKLARWNPDPSTARRRRSIEPLGRLRAGVTVDQARDELRALFAGLAREHPAANAAWTMNVLPIETWIGSLRGANSRALLQLVGGGAIVLLAVALINVTSLTLGRSEQRRRDTLVRRALGATRGRLFAQHLGEGLLIGLPAGLAGAGLASWAVPLVVANYGDTFPRSSMVEFSGSGLLMSAGTGVLAALCIAALAGLRRVESAAALRSDARGTSTASLRARRLLVTSEVALSALLLQAALVVASTIYALAQVDMGVPLDHAITFEIGLPASRYPDESRIAAFVDDLATRVAALPGVRAVGATTRRPFAGGTNGELWLADDPSRRLPIVEYRAVTPGFFDALGIARREGRTFAEGLTSGPRETAQVVISEQLARALFGSASAIGQRLRTAADRSPVEIIGVVGDFRDFGPLRSGRPTIYFRHSFNAVFAPSPFSTVIVRHDGSGPDRTSVIRSTLRDIDRDVPMDAVHTLQALADRSAGTARRTAASLLLWFTGIALTLGAIGIFGVIAVSVERRRREIGIRLAVGDTPSGIRRRVLAEGLKLTAAGLAIAAVGSYWIRGALASFVLADVTPPPWRVLAAAMVVIVAVAIAACMIPARRAARTSLAMALRDS
jgi:putative ABC transport system permease protein